MKSHTVIFIVVLALVVVPMAAAAMIEILARR